MNDEVFVDRAEEEEFVNVSELDGDDEGRCALRLLLYVLGIE